MTFTECADTFARSGVVFRGRNRVRIVLYPYGDNDFINLVLLELQKNPRLQWGGHFSLVIYDLEKCPRF